MSYASLSISPFDSVVIFKVYSPGGKRTKIQDRNTTRPSRRNRLFKYKKNKAKEKNKTSVRERKKLLIPRPNIIISIRKRTNAGSPAVSQMVLSNRLSIGEVARLRVRAATKELHFISFGKIISDTFDLTTPQISLPK